MRRPAPIALIVLPLLALTACGGGGGAGEQETPSPRPNAGTSPVARTGTATPEPADAITSAYTQLDLDKCTVIDASEEGASTDWRCPGLGEVPLFVYEGDGRFDLDAGVENAKFQSIGAFNSIGDRIEWRLRGGVPYAAIFRYHDVTRQDDPRSVLAIEKVGSGDMPGCRVAQIAGDTPDANGRARELADSLTPGFDCANDAMRVIGDAR